MAEISLQSEIFIALYEKVRPTLATSTQTGFQRAISNRMRVFIPSQMVEKLDHVRRIAAAGIALVGEGASHVVLTGEELSMLQEALSQA